MRNDLHTTPATFSSDRPVRKIYPKLENISVDYAILEPATRQEGSPQVYVIPAEIGWSDIGSWAAVYDLLTKHTNENVLAGAGQVLAPRRRMAADG